MLIESQLEVHAHHGEVRSAVGNSDIEGGVAVGLFEEAEDGLWVTEDILGADEASASSLDAHDGSFGGDGSGCSLGVTELLACADGPPGDVVSHEHADSMLDLKGRGIN